MLPSRAIDKIVFPCKKIGHEFVKLIFGNADKMVISEFPSWACHNFEGENDC